MFLVSFHTFLRLRTRYATASSPAIVKTASKPGSPGVDGGVGKEEGEGEEEGAGEAEGVGVGVVSADPI